jgi:putrescine aminotransferase
MEHSFIDNPTGHSSEKDVLLYQKYGNLINAAYPNFLIKLGLTNSAIKAEGATITDSDGQTYIDCVAGYGIHNLGHNHPVIINALLEQIRENGLYGRPLISPIQVQLAQFLSEIIPGELDCSFICNSGSEAIDSAIKLARLVQGKSKIIAMENSFHGYTYGALSASGISAFKRKFGPLVPDVVHVPFGDAAALEKVICKNTAAVLVEPIQHEAGIYLPPPDYFRELRTICSNNRLLLIVDEVKTGCGKTGKMFAYSHYDMEPDVMVLGKSLGGGIFPIGALIANKKLWNNFSMSFSMSASSYAGNALACRVALATLETLHNTSLIPDCAEKGITFLDQLNQVAAPYPDIIKTVRGLGLMVGIQAANPKMCLSLSQEMIKGKVLSLPSFGNSSFLMMEPPLVVTQNQLNEIIAVLEKACKTLNN